MNLSNMNCRSLIALLIINSTFLILEAQETLTWTGSVDGKWSNAQNWNPQTVPTTKDNVKFSGSANCEIDAFACVKGFTVESDYTATITQTSGDICVGEDNLLLYGGKIVGGTANIFYSNEFIADGVDLEFCNGIMDLRSCNGYCTTSIATLSPKLGSGYFLASGDEIIFYFKEKYNKQYSSSNPIDFTVYDYKQIPTTNTGLPMTKIGTNLYSINISTLTKHNSASKSYVLEVRDAKGFTQKLRFKY